MLTLKDYLVYNIKELQKNYIGLINQYELIKSQSLTQVVNDFMNLELHLQVKLIKNLILHHNEPNSYYLCGILYSLLNDDNDGNVNTSNQLNVYNSLPYECKIILKKIKTSYSEKTSLYKKFNINKIPYEHRIEMMNVDDDVKEKAYLKLREVMSKSEESGNKARLYLDGLLKIPFGNYIEEPILKCKDNAIMAYSDLINNLTVFENLLRENGENEISINELLNIKKKDGKIDISFNELKVASSNIVNILVELFIKILQNKQVKIGRFDIKKKIDEYNLIIKSIKLTYKNDTTIIKELHRITTTGKKKNEMMTCYLEIIRKNLTYYVQLGNYEIVEKLLRPMLLNDTILQLLDTMFYSMNIYRNKLNSINDMRTHSFENIDNCIYGHETAKKQIKNIINQWITGEKSGYCFGFEGPPGIGKTSMAKLGLSKCLFSEDKKSRPFDFIALGGSSNGSYLNGHSYTYLGSSWGRIVDILMTKNCMNPIIFIDELDKVSNCEYGKEIIGILTHLVDSTQNTLFQDKYFSGINIDLSKALFVFSYNDPSKIDPILLDRIHRIKFDKLTPFDKLIICNKYLIPELNKNYGFSDNYIKVDETTIFYIIDSYTYESGVRKLKQVLFELWGDINEMLLKDEIKASEFNLTIEVIDELLREKPKMLKISIPKEPSIGIINGLWANALGLGGLTPIQIKWFPCKSPLELKLTGMQGDVMKESMNVAKTIAWNMLSKEEVSVLWNKISGENGPSYGLHIHCPEGAVNKDGPSAGGAITTCLISMFKNKPINNKFAMTGEINLSGSITAIGGLEQKLYYGICAGAEIFAFPEDNKNDYNLFRDKYKDKIKNFNKIKFHSVKHINDVYKLIY
jgi:ATP-dependent Lon protease